jgi:hypothetical protein
MYHESDLFPYFPSESADAFFAPPPQTADAPSPESFDQEVDKEVGEFDLNWSFDQLDNFFFTYRDTIPVISPPALTYSTDSGYEVASSQYSDNIARSSNASEIGTRGSENDRPYTTDNFIFSAAFFDGMLSFPPFSTVAQSDCGTQISSEIHPVTHPPKYPPCNNPLHVSLPHLSLST